jgi:hypothetical protein
MKKIKISLYILGLALALNACTDDLNVTPKDEDIFLSEDFFAQPGAYKQALAGVYGNLSLTGTSDAGSSFLEGIDAGTSQYGRCLWYLQCLTTDEAIWTWENDPGLKELQRNTWTTSNPVLLGMFSRAMAEVSFANQFLSQTTPEKLSGRGITDQTLLNDIATYRGEVRTLRALAYYHIIDLFGKAPFFTETVRTGEEYSRAQMFEFLEDELLAVIPELKAPRTNEYGRVDQAAARMILAKLYLNAEVYIQQNKYNECIGQLNEIIASGFVLNPSYLNNFKADNHTSSEMIFTLQSDGVYTQNYGPTTTMINGQVGSIEKNGVGLGVSVNGWDGALRLRKQFVQKFDGSAFANDDRNTILPAGDRPIDIVNVINPAQGYVLAKYSNVSSTGVPSSNTTFVDTDFPLFRLADAYLMYAECAVRGASEASPALALQYVNALRERANNGSTINNITSSDMTLDFILDERARELYWEGHRRQDLIRFNKYTGGSYNWAWKGSGINGVSLSSHMKLFPIPDQSLRSNLQLSQNTGY